MMVAMSLPEGWRASVPIVHIPRHPLWIDAYQGAWDLLEPWAAQPGALRRPEAAAIMHYARYAFAALPLHDWLDQQFDARLSPLHAWSEWSLYQVTGDTARLARVLPALLEQYFAKLRDLRRRVGLTPGPRRGVRRRGGSSRLAGGLYYHAEGECDMDQSPRAPYGWIDLSAQQAMAAELCARMARAVGAGAEAEACEAEWRGLRALIEQRCWDDSSQFYTDCGPNGETQPVKTVAGLWPCWRAWPRRNGPSGWPRT